MSDLVPVEESRADFHVEIFVAIFFHENIDNNRADKTRCAREQ